MGCNTYPYLVYSILILNYSCVSPSSSYGHLVTSATYSLSEWNPLIDEHVQTGMDYYRRRVLEDAFGL